MNINDSKRTPLSPDYPTCLECRASLFIYPGVIHPDEISRLLNIEPTQKNIPGTIITNSLGRTREIKFSGWFLSSENYVESKDIRDHIDWLLTILNPSSIQLNKLQNTEGVKMGINCVWVSRSGNGGPTLWPEQMRAMSNLNLECSFDIYFYSDEELA